MSIIRKNGWRIVIDEDGMFSIEFQAMCDGWVSYERTAERQEALILFNEGVTNYSFKNAVIVNNMLVASPFVLVAFGILLSVFMT